MLYPFTFRPIFKERVWGGRRLAELYSKPLPKDVPIGESWEISDRPGDVSVITNGPLAGKDLHWLVDNHRTDLLGDAAASNGRFPLLIKILDARDKLSLQVHPPAWKAAALGGEPKTEMWHITDADPGAELFVGLKSGVTRQKFEESVQQGTVSRCFHRIPVKAGDTMFLPSGRVHAIGAGLVIFEIQQNSDTTYRVYDWDRVGLDGKPRELHIRQSIESIAFDDFEPALASGRSLSEGSLELHELVTDPLFHVSRCTLKSGRHWQPGAGMLRILGVLKGLGTISGSGVTQHLAPGQFCMLPACVSDATLTAETDVHFLDVTCG